MTAPITSSAPSAGASATADAGGLQELKDLMGQNMLMRMQSNQQAMSKTMNKMTESIKNSMQDEE